MRISNFGDELGTDRMIVGKRFMHWVKQTEITLQRLNQATDTLLEIRQQVQNNDPPIFDDGDLQYVNAQLLELRTAIRAHADSLP